MPDTYCSKTKFVTKANNTLIMNRESLTCPRPYTSTRSVRVAHNDRGAFKVHGKDFNEFDLGKVGDGRHGAGKRVQQSGKR